MNRRMIAASAAVALLVIGCGSEQPSAIVTVSATVTATAATTIEKTTTVAAGTKTVATTFSSTKTAATTVIAEPDALAGRTCAAVGAELSSIDVLAAMQKWSGGASLTVGDLVDGFSLFEEIPSKTSPADLALLVDDLNEAGAALRDADSDDWQERANDVMDAWSDVTEYCTTAGTPIPAVKVQVSTVSTTVKVPVGGDGKPVATIGNGTHLIPGEIQAGAWRCDGGADDVYWETTSQDGEIVQNGIDAIAYVTADAFSVTLKRCGGDWQKVG